MEVIVLIKFLATLLITNSHMGRIYPEQVDFLATGALVGNSLFCFASGYVLFSSRMKSVGMWFFRRFIRLYLPYWTFLAFTIVVLGYAFQFKQIFISHCWFIAAISVFYLIYFPVVRYVPRFIPHIIGLTLVAYAAVYYHINHSVFMVEDVYNSAKIVWFYYFALMLVGAWAAKKKVQKGNWIDGVITLGFVAIYYGFKGALVGGYVPMQLQILLPLLSLPYAYYAFKALYALDHFVNYDTLYGRIIKYISTLTIEIYIVQFAVISGVLKLGVSNGVFRLAIAFIGIMIGASILKLVVNGINRIFTSVSRNLYSRKLLEKRH